MKLDNLFIVGSPLQALVALELSLQFSNQSNGIIYRLFGKKRERNNQQIEKVLAKGHWNYISSIEFDRRIGITYLLSIRTSVLRIRKQFNGNVGSLFFGDFRSQWMHLVRAAVLAEKDILMDDGAATITVKRKYLDSLIYYPAEIWRERNYLKRFVKELIYFDLEIPSLASPVVLASAFFRDESEFPVTFSRVKDRFTGMGPVPESKVSLFFGSKYSEAGIISRKYEIEFIGRVKKYYFNRGIDMVYCAHREESKEKLDYIQNVLGITVRTPDLPAELYLLTCHPEVQEIAAAYSSVLNNLNVMFPEKVVRSFLLLESEVFEKYRKNIVEVYEFFRLNGIPVEREF